MTAEKDMENANRSRDQILHELEVHQIELEMQNEALREAQIELEASRDRYMDFYDHSPVGFVTLNHDGLINEINLTGAALLSVARNKLPRRRFSSYIAAEDRDRWYQYFQSLLTSCENSTCELLFQHDDKPPFYAQLDCMCLQHAGKDAEVRIVLTDITERKKMEASCAESRHLLQTIIDTAPVRIFWKDRTSRYLGCNPAFAQDAGVSTAADIIGKDDGQLSWKAQAELYRMDDRQVMDSGTPKLLYDEPSTTPEGESIWLRTSKVPLRNSVDEIIGMLGVYQDITELKQAESMLRVNEAKYRAIIDATPVPLVMNDAKGNITYLNQAFIHKFGYTLDEIPTLNDWWPRAYPDPKYRQWVIESWNRHMSEAIRSNEDFIPLELNIRCKDGRARTVMVGAASLGDGFDNTHLVVLYDITARKQAEADLRIAAATFETQDAILITDVNSNIIRVNRAFTEITGYSAAEVLGKNPRIMRSGRQPRAFYIEMWQQLLHNGAWAGEIWDKRKNGEVYPKWMSVTAIKDEQQLTTHYVAIFSDITARKRAEEETHKLAFYDVLTRLPNRRLLLDRMRAALVASARRSDYGALLFIDMDRFKLINDTLGHDYGDLLLIEVGARIKSCVREMDTVARFGGDEFVVLLEGISNMQDHSLRKVALLADKIRAALALPYKLNEHEHQSSPSIGVTLFHGNEEALEMLIEHADKAMYEAKHSGRNAVRFFDPTMQRNVSLHDTLQDDMHQILALQQLQLHYQVQVDKNARPLGAEAFLRWMHPEHGMLLAEQFIPIAEESALIIDIDRWVLQTACQQLALWSRNDKTVDLTLTINISAKQFSQADFVDKIAEMLNLHQVDPRCLKLELSERLVLTDINRSIEKIYALKNMGVRLSMDNFGAVFSSLSYLKQLSSDQLKISQKIVQGISLEGNDAQLVETVANLARSLDLTIFAEGVETEAQRIFLKDQDCSAYQGYLFGKPVPIEEFEALLGKL
ncbi:MAG: EAL domain-containing protein [Gallionella sp.]|nr:EAL domain-containing protein [Gallionella sp.]